MNRDKCKRALFLCVKYLVSAAVVAVVVGPLLVTLFTSVKTQAQLASTSPILPPVRGTGTTMPRCWARSCCPWQ